MFGDVADVLRCQGILPIHADKSLIASLSSPGSPGRFGHATAASTMDRYGHDLESADKAAAAVMAGVLAKDRPSAQNGSVL